MTTHTQTTREILLSYILRLTKEVEIKRNCLKDKSYEEFKQATEIEMESIQVQIEFLKKALIEG